MIQIDMQMPTSCLDCPACNEYMICAIPVNGRKWGENDVREYGNGRPEWCPLREQEAVVRCKDCKYWSAERINDFNKCRRWINVGVKNFATMGDWFCADGRRKDEVDG